MGTNNGGKRQPGVPVSNKLSSAEVKEDPARLGFAVIACALHDVTTLPEWSKEYEDAYHYMTRPGVEPDYVFSVDSICAMHGLDPIAVAELISSKFPLPNVPKSQHAR